MAQGYQVRFQADIFGQPPRYYGQFTTFPGIPHLIALSATFEPFDSSCPDGQGENVNEYSNGGWKVTVNYGVPTADSVKDGRQQAREQGGDGTGPGGDKGSQDGADKDGTKGSAFITHDVDIGAEFMTLDSLGFEWLDGDINGSVVIPRNVTIGKVTPHIEHTLKLKMRQPPWIGIRACIGTVNELEFVGVPPECMLFVGVAASWDLNEQGVGEWSCTYKFSEKRNGGTDDLGWNHVWRGDTGQFERIIRKNSGTDGIYLKAPFYMLFDFDR